MRLPLSALPLAALLLAGCPSAYQRTYDQEMSRLEAQARMQEERDVEEARKYVAVVLFAVNSAEIDAAGARELDWFLEQIAGVPSAHLDVRGYADATGSEAHNQPLSQKRAWAVQEYLISRGVPANQVSAQALGSDDPAETNATARGRRQNRRAEVRVR